MLQGEVALLTLHLKNIGHVRWLVPLTTYFVTNYLCGADGIGAS